MNFSFDTIDNFEEHIETSVPGYKQLNEYIISILGYFLNNSKLVDIGCSTGYLLNKISFFYPDNELIGLDISQNLFNQAKINDKISLVEFDLNKEELIKADVYTSIFTLQFLPIATRIKIIKDIYNKLPKGGCFILSEKIFLDNGKMQDIYNFSHYDYKEKTFSANDIFKKQKDLRRIMKPITEKENIDYIKDAGFTNVESFWQNLLFKAWLCIK
jgi:tRNA (cmo5U34)-methyltransferase